MSGTRRAVWQRLPDITPNYGQLDRRSKLLVPTIGHSREASVIIRDNVSTKHQLNIRLSTLTVERLRTIRLLNTTRQSFIARQSAKQRHLERAGITDVALLPPQMMLLTTPSEAAEMASRSRDVTTRRCHDLATTARTGNGNRLPTIDGGNKMAVDAGQPDAIKVVVMTSSATATNQPEVDTNRRPAKVLNNGDSAAMTSSFMTHNFRRRSSSVSSDDVFVPAVTSDRATLPASSHVTASGDDQSGRPVAVTCYQDRRFLSLMDSLSARCPPGADTYVQLSPSGSQVLGRYAKPACDLTLVRQAIDANGDSAARLRHVRTATTGGGSRATPGARPRQQYNNGVSLLARSKTTLAF